MILIIFFYKTDPTLAENFDEEFTNEIIKESPIENHLDDKMKDYFLNFSYVAQSNILLNQQFEK
jgi:hypothetical protein